MQSIVIFIAVPRRCGSHLSRWSITKFEIGYDSQLTPLILHGSHAISKLIIHSEHLHLLHAGPLLVTASLNQRFHIIGGRRAVRSNRTQLYM